jgi:hypothetical protein
LNELQIEDETVSDTSWIKPGMYVTPGEDIDSNDRIRRGDVYVVESVDVTHIRFREAHGDMWKYPRSYRMHRMEWPCNVFRELSPSYVEAMTGEKVEVPACLTDCTITPMNAGAWKHERERASKDAHNWQVAALQKRLGTYRVEIEAMRDEGEAAKRMIAELLMANDGLLAKLAAIRKEVG